MADPTNKVPENAPGHYYVDDTCIDCELCRETAPGNFLRWDRGRYSFVARQPSDPDEDAACRVALDECPVEAIGREGEGKDD